MELYTYYRSVAAQRVRTVLNYKGLVYESRFIDLTDEGTHKDYKFYALNPQGLAPVLVDQGLVITQSVAIMEYLEETYPSRPMLPTDAAGRARVRSLTQLFACDMQPLNNLRVMRYLRSVLHCNEAQLQAWHRQWVMEGLQAAEVLLASHETGAYCHGGMPTFADACLVAEVHNALEHRYDLADFPIVRRIYRTCLALAAFQAAAPETQPDAKMESTVLDRPLL
jgi:maleylacetoacetate isomerase